MNTSVIYSMTIAEVATTNGNSARKKISAKLSSSLVEDTLAGSQALSTIPGCSGSCQHYCDLVSRPGIAPCLAWCSATQGGKI